MNGKIVNPATGKQVSGAALWQMVIKQNGGWVEHHQKFAEAMLEECTKSYLDEQERQLRKQSFRAF